MCYNVLVNQIENTNTMNTNLSYRNSIHYDMHWKTATSSIKNAIEEFIDVNEQPLEGRKKNYFRFYINGNPLHYVGILFGDLGSILSYDYYEGDIKNDTLISRGGWWRGSKKEVVSFVKYVFEMLFIKNFHRNENEHRLFNLIYHKCSKNLY